MPEFLAAAEDIDTLAKAKVEPRPDMRADVIVIGAGPTGLACAIEAQKIGLKVIVLDKGCLVNSLFHYPANMVFFTTPELLDDPRVSESLPPPSCICTRPSNVTVSPFWVPMVTVSAPLPVWSWKAPWNVELSIATVPPPLPVWIWVQPSTVVPPTPTESPRPLPTWIRASPPTDADINILGTINVLEGARAAGSERIVFAACGQSLYGDPMPADLPVREAHPHRPRSLHGVSKKSAIDYLAAYREVHAL